MKDQKAKVHTEKRLSRKTIYSGRIFNVYKDMVQLENGDTTSREYIEHFGGVAVVAVTPDDKIIMVRQYRYGAGETMLELPAGKIDKGESPEICGIRELEEETGYIPRHMVRLVDMYPTPAYDSEVIYIYLAENLEKGVQKLDDHEFLTVLELPFEKVMEMVAAGEINDAKTLVGLLMYAQKKGRQI